MRKIAATTIQADFVHPILPIWEPELDESVDKVFDWLEDEEMPDHFFDYCHMRTTRC